MDESKLPLPVMSLDFRFLTSNAQPQVSILEVQTNGNPIRIGFDRHQLEKLSRQAAIAATKVTPL
jgi:hypothetical protein